MKEARDDQNKLLIEETHTRLLSNRNDMRFGAVVAFESNNGIETLPASYRVLTQHSLKLRGPRFGGSNFHQELQVCGAWPLAKIILTCIGS